MSELKKLQKTLFNIYNNNIHFFKNNFPQLYQKIIDFESMNYETRYIDFRDGYFELVECKTEKATYNCNSFYDAEYRGKEIYSSNAIFSMIVDKIDSKNYNMDDEISAHKFVKDILNLKNNSYRTEKFIFIGTLLGIHINEIHKKLEQKVYLIIEPNIEIFRLSLFFTDYKEIAKESTLFFSIDENERQREKTLLKFLEYDFSLNHHIKFELASEKEFFLIEEIKNIITSSNPFITAFSEDILSMKRGLDNIQKSNGLIKINNLKLFDEKPILILGAGPSLEKYQDFIKQNQSKFIIISASAALKRLEYLDVIPDIIINIDKKEREILNQFDVAEHYYKNSICFLGPKTNPKVLKKISSTSIFIVQENYEIFKGFETINCVSVGDFAYKLSLKLGAKNIYILGIDASFSKNNTHDSFHINANISSENAYEKTIIKVQGNLQKNVYTNLLYAEIINSFKKIEFQDDVNVYNLSNGAKLYNTIPLKVETINLSLKIIEKKIFKKNIIKSLQKNIIKDIQKIDIKEFKKEFKILKKLEKDIEDKNIIEQLNKNKNSKSLKILYKYLKLINPYISSTNNHQIKKTFTDELVLTLKNIFNI